MHQFTIHPGLIFLGGAILGACLGLLAAALIFTNRLHKPEDDTARFKQLREDYKDAP